MKERIQKIIANVGIASRRAAEEMMLRGEVTVNGKPVTELGTKADPQRDHIKVRGKLITGGRGQITGRFDFTEAQDLANVLRNGALPAPLKLMEERTVGPSLGQDSIRNGVLSFVVGASLVIAFMVLYYRGGVLIADGALLMNVLLLVATFAAFGFTLSLPGIAGIVLTIGMAVDANVLILERIREELRLGKSPRAAIDAGYERAWYAIRDSNLTTFLSGLILFQFGSGPVRGFAVTLCVGILTSLATGVFGTRVVYDLLTTRRRLTTVSV